MPRIPPDVLNAVFYLYPSVEAARDGREFGGTGFLYGLPTGHGVRLIYAFTNWHVAVRDGASVARINTIDGGCDIIDLDPSQWYFKPGWHDLAVTPFPINDDKHLYRMLAPDFLATPEIIKERDIGEGEDVFMIGRFVDHDGGATNVPAVRFGNISVMPQMITQPTGARLPSYILDVHSRTGYSGSPVFAFRTAGNDLTVPGLIGGHKSKFIYLLGVHWGQFPERWDIESGEAGSGGEAAVTANEKFVKGWSGMTLAIPATAISELLDLPELKEHREIVMNRVKRGFPLAPKAEGARPETVQAAPAKSE